MTPKRIRHDKGKAEPIKVLVQRVEYGEDGTPVLVHDTVEVHSLNDLTEIDDLPD